MNYFILFTLLFSLSNSFASQDIASEKPIMKAEMKMINIAGEYEKVQSFNLTLLKRDGSPAPTSMELLLRKKMLCGDPVPACSIIPIKYDLAILDIKDYGCGTNVYIAIFKSDAEKKVEESKSNFTLVLYDNTQNKCKEKGWHVFIREKAVYGKTDGMAELEGNPEPVVDTN